MVSTTTVPTFEATSLSHKIRKALQQPSFQMDDWHCTPLMGHISNPATGGLYRVAGTGRQNGQERPWSLILKIAHLAEDAPQGWGSDLLHFGYWRREALAYQSGILKEMGANLRVPDCFDVEERSDGSIWLWLEDIPGSDQEAWSLERYGQAALHFGQWQGTYLTETALPVIPWLRTGWLRSWVAHFAFLEEYFRLPDFWEHPLMKAAFPVPVADRLLALWADRADWLELLDRMPLTLCHFDTWRPNLLACTMPDGLDQTVVLDWQCMGLGPAGEVGNLLLTALMTLEVPASEAKALDTLIWENYVQGLQEAGWSGKLQHVRFCYTAYPALRWVLVFPMLMILPYVLNPQKRTEAEAKYGQSIEQLLRRWASVIYVLLDLGEEAHEIASELHTEVSLG